MCTVFTFASPSFVEHPGLAMFRSPVQRFLRCPESAIVAATLFGSWKTPSPQVPLLLCRSAQGRERHRCGAPCAPRHGTWTGPPDCMCGGCALPSAHLRKSEEDVEDGRNIKAEQNALARYLHHPAALLDTLMVWQDGCQGVR